MLKELARRLPRLTVLENPWVEFQDQEGLGWAQPDAVVGWDGEAGASGQQTLTSGASKELPRSPAILVVEAKLTHCLDARLQLQALYAPLVGHLWSGRRVILLAVVRHLRADLDAIPREGPEEFWTWQDDGQVNLWHWPDW